jgi:zinc protease
VTVIVHGSVGDLRVVHAPSAGPTAASLLFRVGIVDEPLPWRGLTRLVERLTLAGLQGAHPDAVAFTGLSETRFAAQGDPQSVSRFLSLTVAGLHRLGAEELEEARRAVRAEGDDGGQLLSAVALASRFGPNGYGLVGYPELGIHQPGVRPVRNWVEQRFVADNAVLAVFGEMPTDLELDLPTGVHHPPPPPAAPLLGLPAWIPAEFSGTLVSMVVPQATTLAPLAHHLDRAASDHLRRQLGESYPVEVWIEPLDADQAHLLVLARAPARAGDQVCRAIVELLDRFVDGGVTNAEHRRTIDELREFAASPAGPPSDLDDASRAVLNRREPVSLQQTCDELEAFDPSRFGELLGTHLESALYLLGGVDDPPQALKALPASWPRTPVDGRKHVRRLRAGEDKRALDDRLILGTDGITLQTPMWSSTVRFGEIRAVEAYSDGPRVLLGGDGSSVVVDPNDWEGGHKVREAIDQRVPPSLVVRVGSSGTATVPRRYGVSNAVLVLWIVVAVVSIGGAVTGTFPEPSTNGGPGPFRIAWLAMLAALAGWAGWTLWRRRHD